MGPRLLASSLIGCLMAALVAGAAEAQTSATSTTDSSISISEPAAIGVSQNLSFTVLPGTVNTGLTITSSAANGLNANITLTGTQTTSVSVPASFDVVRTGGTETITVRTVGAVSNVTGVTGATQVTGVANGGVFSNPVTVVGTLDSGVLSFSVGGAVTLANNLVPGEYQGVLTVIAQYN